MSVGKDVPGIVEDDKTDIVLEERQGRRGHAQFDAVDKQRRTAQGKAGRRIPRPGLIQSEPTKRISAAGEKTLGQRKARPLSRLSLLALGSRLGHEGVAKRSLNSDARGTGEHKFLVRVPLSADGVVSGILDQQSAEVGLRAKVAVRHAAVNRGVVSLGGFEIIVTLVANVTEVGNRNPCGLGEQWNLVLAYGVLDVARPHPPVGETVGHKAGLVDCLFSLD